MEYVYMLECADGSYYIGWTNDIAARLETHNAGKGAKYTRARLPVKLVYLECHDDRGEAKSREALLKKLTHRQRGALIGSAENRAGDFTKAQAEN